MFENDAEEKMSVRERRCDGGLSHIPPKCRCNAVHLSDSDPLNGKGFLVLVM